ncbi:MAG TPA: enoyl-CoA hydratase [Planctomycetaceae bacterium]|jgi:enoyl-CoA hydratase/carnithine racemase|nr:enoyl-CoA hydratase [Planctomycetaceae bacterium]
MNEQIGYESADGVAQIRIDRPDKKNALTAAMYTGLVEAFLRAEADPAVRVLLLCGSETCFTAGNDLQDFMNAPPRDDSSPTIRFLKQLPATHKPLIAAVAGPAIGIGTTMLLHCDLVYADPNTKFQLPFVTLGLCPEAASSFLLPQIFGHPRAAEMLLLGDPFSATQALEMGLINGITPAGEVIATAAIKARQMAERPAASLLLTKALLKRAHARQVEETMNEELGHFGARLKSPEAAEAFRAFFERRKPDFSKFA